MNINIAATIQWITVCKFGMRIQFPLYNLRVEISLCTEKIIQKNPVICLLYNM